MDNIDASTEQVVRNDTTQRNAPLGIASMALATTCALIWAGQSVAVKVALEDVPTLFLMTSRFVLALPVIYVIGRVSGVTFSTTWQEGRVLAVSALLLCLQIALYTIGTNLTSSIHSIILINAFPFFTVLFARIWLPESDLNRRTVAGLAIAFTGIIFIVGDRLDGTSFSTIGDLLVLCAAIVIGAKIVYMKRAFRSVSTIKLVLWDNVGAMMLLLPAGLALENWRDVSIDGSSMLAILYQGVVVSAIAFLIWVRLISRHSPNELNVFRMATPPMGAILGALILAEPLSPGVYVSLACVCIGAYCVLA